MKNNDSKLQTFIKSGFIQVLLAITSVICAIVALYVTSRIQPLVQADSILDVRVKAVEVDYARASLVQTGFSHINEKFDAQDKKLEIMDDKLDTLLRNK